MIRVKTTIATANKNAHFLLGNATLTENKKVEHLFSHLIQLGSFGEWVRVACGQSFFHRTACHKRIFLTLNLRRMSCRKFSRPSIRSAFDFRVPSEWRCSSTITEGGVACGCFPASSLSLPAFAWVCISGKNKPFNSEAAEAAG